MAVVLVAVFVYRMRQSSNPVEDFTNLPFRDLADLNYDYIIGEWKFLM